jgi:hypothetical protein
LDRFGPICSGVDVDGHGAEEGSDGGDFGDTFVTLLGSGTSIFVGRIGLDPTV